MTTRDRAEKNNHDSASFEDEEKINIGEWFVAAREAIRHRLNHHFYIFLKYIIGSTLNYFVSIGITAVLTEFAGIYYLYAYIGGLAIAIVLSFYYSSHITFKKTNQRLKRATKFTFVSVVLYFFDVLLVWLSTNIFGIHYVFSITFVTFGLFIIRFFWLKNRVFN